MAYFLKKSILSVHSGEKPTRSIKMKLKIGLKMMDLAGFSPHWTLIINFSKKQAINQKWTRQIFLLSLCVARVKRRSSNNSSLRKFFEKTSLQKCLFQAFSKRLRSSEGKIGFPWVPESIFKKSFKIVLNMIGKLLGTLWGPKHIQTTFGSHSLL